MERKKPMAISRDTPFHERSPFSYIELYRASHGAAAVQLLYTSRSGGGGVQYVLTVALGIAELYQAVLPVDTDSRINVFHELDQAEPHSSGRRE